MSVRPVKSVQSVNTDNTDCTEDNGGTDNTDGTDSTDCTDSQIHRDSLYMMHKTIKKVTEDIENLDYNTAIAALMEWVNFLEKKIVNCLQSTVHSRKETVNCEPITREEIKALLLLLAPFAPHMTEELFQQFFGRGPVRTFPPTNARSNEKPIVDQKDKVELRVGGDLSSSATPFFKSIHLEKWPEFDEKLAVSQKVTVVVQVNGRLRDKIEVERGKSKEEVLKMARELQNITKYLSVGKVVAEIYVADKLVNFVMK